MWHFIFGLVLLSAGLHSVAEAVSADAWQVLERSAHAARELNYEGQFRYINGKHARTVDTTHMNYGGNEVARNIVLDKSHREVYSQGADIVIIQPTDKNVVIKRRRGQNLFPAMLPTDLSGIKQQYKAVLAGTEFVAGREAHIVELLPSDAYRYRYKIWTDTKFGLILRMAVLNDENKTLEQVYFNKLSMLNSQNLDWFQPKIEMGKNYVTEQTKPIKRVANDLMITQLPAGYREVDHIQRVVDRDNTVVDQFIFSDGIGSVSVFIEPFTKGKRLKKGYMLVGSTNICAEVIKGRQVIVVGEVPAATVKSIAKAVSFKR